MSTDQDSYEIGEITVIPDKYLEKLNLVGQNVNFVFEFDFQRLGPKYLKYYLSDCKRAIKRSNPKQIVMFCESKELFKQESYLNSIFKSEFVLLESKPSLKPCTSRMILSLDLQSNEEA